MDEKSIPLQFMGSAATKRSSVIPLIVAITGLCALYRVSGNQQSTTMALRAFAFAALAVLALAAILTLVESLTRYETDSDGITRVAWNGSRRVRWKQIVRSRTRGRNASVVQLGDDAGRRLTIYFLFIGVNSRPALRRIVSPYLPSTQPAKQSELEPASNK